MELAILITTLVVGANLITPATAAAGWPSPARTHVVAELLVAPREGVSADALRDVYRRRGGALIKVLHGINVHHVRVPAAALDAVEAALAQSPRVQYVERNFLGRGGITPNDPGYSFQWHLAKIEAATGWGVTTGSDAVPIAVVDSGVDPTHPDLADKLWPGFNFLSDSTDTRDVLGHGTAVAGTAAALTNDGLGVAGLAWTNPIMPLVVLNSHNYATYADIASAIIYATDHGARVVNISIGGTNYSSTLQSAVDYAWARGVIIVACAMNAATDTPYYPAALSNVIAVSATDQSDSKASFSNFGDWIDLAAPGTSIYTTANGGGYAYASGTSFAAPQVAALAALVVSRNPDLSNSEVVSLLASKADDLGPQGPDTFYGWGRINAGRTLQATHLTAPGATTGSASDSTAPTVTITSVVSYSRVVTVGVSAMDPNGSGVVRVDLYVDGVLKAKDTIDPWAFKISMKLGTHTIRAEAYDAAGNRGISSPVTINR